MITRFETCCSRYNQSYCNGIKPRRRLTCIDDCELDVTESSMSPPDMLMRIGIPESAPLDIHRRQVVCANTAMINMQMAQRSHSPGLRIKLKQDALVTDRLLRIVLMSR